MKNVVDTIAMKAAQIKYYRKCIDTLNRVVNEPERRIFQGIPFPDNPTLWVPEIDFTDALVEPQVRCAVIAIWEQCIKKLATEIKELSEEL